MCGDGAGVTSATAYSVSMTFLHFRSALESPPNRRPTDAGRTLHDNKAGAFKMPYKALCDDVSHELGSVPLAAPSVESQRERERVRKVGGFRREVQPRRQHWFLNEKSGFPFRTPVFCSVSKGQRRLGEKEYRPLQ
jgi:hypothetical protein